MNKLITKLSENLISYIKKADEMWVAVALLNSTGLKFLTGKLPDACIQHYLIGVDLPTEPKALWSLFEMQLKSTVTANLYADREYFHPKLYLFRKANLYKAFIGSANCTNGGLNGNIELTVSVDDQETCKELKSWFEKLSAKAKPLTKKFLQKYQDDYSQRREREREEERTAKKEKQELNEEYIARLSERREFIKVLKSYRHQTNQYKKVVAERIATVKEIRSTLDYPSFSDIDIDGFFRIWKLGHIISLPKPTIKREIKKFSKLLTMLCDERTDIAVRYNRALEGELKIRGINEGLVSKILVIHNPDLYFVKNDKTTAALKKYGIELPRGLTKGDKYKITCKFLRQICIETDIKNLAVLDHYLYIEGNEG